MLEVFFGFIFGILSSAGIGGGTVLIPLLTLFLAVDIADAQTASIIAFLPASIIALIIHMKNKRAQWKYAKKYILTGCIFAFISAFFVQFLPRVLLRRIFGGFLIVFSVVQIISVYKDINKK